MSKVNWTRPFVYPYQRAILDAEARYTVCEASTKVGKTASHIIWLFEQALMCGSNPTTRKVILIEEGGRKIFIPNTDFKLLNQSVWWIAPTVAQAKISYNRMKIQLNDKEFISCNETNRVITLWSGVKMEFKTAENPDNLYGDDVYAFVFDEFTRAREAAWFALRSTVTSTGGKGKFIGNVKGKKNWGHKLAMKAKSGIDKDFEYFKITAYDAADAGMMTKDGRPFIEEIEAAKRDLPEAVFNELYLAEASEDGSNPFGLKYIAQCCQTTLSKEPSICYGVDVARKVDFTSIIGLDKLAVMSHYHNFNKVGWQNIIDAINYLPSKPMAIDSTGVGDVVVSQVEKKHPTIEPYIFSERSKQTLLEGLAIGFQQRKLIIADDGDVVNGTGKLRHQLEQFEFEYTRTGVRYSAPEGEHDDDVYALALAWHKWHKADQEGEFDVL